MSVRVCVCVCVCVHIYPTPSRPVGCNFRIGESQSDVVWCQI